MTQRTKQTAALVAPDGTAKTGLLESGRTHPGGDEDVLDRIGR